MKMSPEQIALSERSHLLEWHAAYCVTIAEKCKGVKAARLLRQLAVDLAIEAHRCRQGRSVLTEAPQNFYKPATEEEDAKGSA
jgi:hypothetical protein